VARPPKSRELKDILSLYSEEQSPNVRPNGGKRARRRR
jgi:hypothetical protein